MREETCRAAPVPAVPTLGTANSAAETSDGEYVEANSECGHETNEASDGATGTTEGTDSQPEPSSSRAEQREVIEWASLSASSRVTSRYCPEAREERDSTAASNSSSLNYTL